MGKYDDIITLPHHVSRKRARMSMVDRGAQFSPFAALTGYDGVIEETARLTDRQVELDENRKTELNRRLALLAQGIREEPEVTVTWFVPDERKAGGEYARRTGRCLKVDEYRQSLLLEDGTEVPFDGITGLEGTIFSCLE